MNGAEKIALNKMTEALNKTPKEDLENLSNTLVWGTYGGGSSKSLLKPVKLCDLELDHIRNILLTQNHISFEYRNVLMYLYDKKMAERNSNEVIFEKLKAVDEKMAQSVLYLSRVVQIMSGAEKMKLNGRW